MNEQAYQSNYAIELAAGKGPGFEERLESKLRDMNLVLPEETFLGFHEIYNWKKGGAETYVAAARLDVDDRSRTFISKAIIAFGIFERISAMIRRKGWLEEMGIRTPEVYSIEGGCINQEYIPLSPEEALKNSERAEELAIIAARLDKRGFSTLNFVRDLRADEESWYYTDWGFDLGEPGKENSSALTTLLRLAGMEFPERVASIKSVYELEKYR